MSDKHKEFKKFDSKKPCYELLPPKAIEEVVQVLTFGAEKYERHNWKKCRDLDRLIGATLRHIFAALDGEQNDPETGIDHYAHAVCDLLFLQELKYIIAAEKTKYWTVACDDQDVKTESDVEIGQFTSTLKHSTSVSSDDKSEDVTLTEYPNQTGKSNTEKLNDIANDIKEKYEKHMTIDTDEPGRVKDIHLKSEVKHPYQKLKDKLFGQTEMKEPETRTDKKLREPEPHWKDPSGDLDKIDEVLDKPGLELKYYTLNPTAKDQAHAIASRQAILAYAEVIKEVNYKLSRDLKDWVDRARYKTK